MSTPPTITLTSVSCLGVDRRPVRRHGWSPVRSSQSRQERTIDVSVINLSGEGLVVHCSERLSPGTVVSLDLPGVVSTPARIVEAGADRYVLAFIDPASSAALIAGRSVEDLAGLRVARPRDPQGEVEMERWPRFVRGWFILGAAVASWAVIYWLIR